MIADDHPIAGELGAFDLADHVPDDAALIILHGDQVNLDAALPFSQSEVIAEAQPALPALRHTGSLQGLQDGRGIVVADGDGDDAGLAAVRRNAR